MGDSGGGVILLNDRDRYTLQLNICFNKAHVKEKYMANGALILKPLPGNDIHCFLVQFICNMNK